MYTKVVDWSLFTLTIIHKNFVLKIFCFLYPKRTLMNTKAVLNRFHLPWLSSEENKTLLM